MAIPETFWTNFETLLRAARPGDLALMECIDALTGVPRFVICAVERGDNGDYLMPPFGHLHAGNPFEDYLPPTDRASDGS